MSGFLVTPSIYNENSLLLLVEWYVDTDSDGIQAILTKSKYIGRQLFLEVTQHENNKRLGNEADRRDRLD
jgi:hypothetical protein